MRKPLPNTRYITLADAMRRSTLSRTTMWRMQNAREFPESHKISRGRVAIRESEFNEWLNGTWSHKPPFRLLRPKPRFPYPSNLVLPVPSWRPAH
ncbi:MAG: AlpA family phage regulatory protein [Pseudomonadota bacterium]